MDTRIPAENFARWDAALQTGDTKKMVALYAHNLTLLPTMISKTIKNRKGAQKYFEFFGSFHPTVNILEEYAIPVSEESYVHCGVYRFVLDTPAGKREPLDARFSFLWKKNGAGWEILHHHSSRVLVVTQDGKLLNGKFNI